MIVPACLVDMLKFISMLLACGVLALHPGTDGFRD